ncbi:MAG: precorrin-6A reductase [Enterocloster bolteae]
MAEYLQELNQPFVICVATGYGRDLLEDISRPDENGCMEIRQGRLDVTEMERMFDELRPELVIDATHPYAVAVTQNIKMACSKRKGLRLLRCLREPGAGDNRPGVIHMPDVEAAAAWLSSVKGNILVPQAARSRLRIQGWDYGQRIYARILPSAEAVAQCRSLGFEGRHIIAMQGPFSEEMNLAQLREYGCAYLVTKDGGAAGGFSEKIKAAHRAGAAAVVIDRPGSGEGISLDDIKGQLKEWMDHEKKGSIYG